MFLLDLKNNSNNFSLTVGIEIIPKINDQTK